MKTDTHTRIAEREHQLRALRPAFIESIIVRELCGPWWLRWLWWLNVLLVRHQVRVLVEARAQAAKRLEARAKAQQPAAMTKAEREFVIRSVKEGASDEVILADLEATGPKADAVRRGLTYVRNALSVNASVAAVAKASQPESPFANINLSLAGAHGAPGPFTFEREVARVIDAIPPRPLPEDYPNVYPVDRP